MKKMKNIGLIIAIGGLILTSACNLNDYVDPTATTMKDLKVPSNFDYKLSRDIELAVIVQNSAGVLNKVPVSVYLDNPGTGEEPNTAARLAGTYLSGSDGRIDATLHIASYIDTLWLQTNYIGIESLVGIYVVSGTAVYQYGSGTGILPATPPMAGQGVLKNAVTYSYLGTFNKTGVPDYLLTPRDVITQDFLADVNASLPERLRLPDSHPDYLDSGNEADIVLKEEADIWVTFVHEGAGYLNALGFYEYDQTAPPKSKTDIKKHTIIFPNASFSGSGGGLFSGDKVYLGRFKGGTALGWFLVSSGFSNGKVTGQTIYYSEPSFNPEAIADKKQHTVLLYDSKRGVLLLGMEDMSRTGGSDDDFNDAVFYVTANPVKAVDVSRVPPLDTPTDKDKDGVSDTFDQYPEDPNFAYDSYYPAKDQMGSFVVEDLWPGFGDFDFNDLVIDFNFHEKLDPQNRVKEMIINLKPRAIGASYRNGFGIQLPVSASVISKVRGYNVGGEYIKLSNGLETNQSTAVIAAFEDAYDVLPYNGSGTGVNVEPGKGYTEPKTMEISVTFSPAQTVAQLGKAPYNPFLIIDGNREKEIHMSGYKPTDLANTKLFGQSQDASDPSKGWYYRSENNFVWMLEIPVSFDYMIEKNDLVKGYLHYAKWAESGGVEYPDWYLDKEGYRESSLIYKK
jgi:LruC domain-containing protein